MKKIGLFLILVSVIACLFSCHSTVNSDIDNANKSTDPGIEDTNAVQDQGDNNVFTIIQRYGNHGGVSSVEFISAPEVAFVTDQNEWDKSLPIYYDKFPSNQLGPMYEITDEIVGSMQNNLKEYLSILYEEDIRSDELKIPSYLEDKVYYKRDNTEFYSGMKFISVLTPKASIEGEISVNTTQTNELLKAAIEYLGIKCPQMKMTVQYDTNDSPYSRSYVFFEETTNASEYLYNTTFCYVEIINNIDTDNYLILINKIDSPEVCSNIDTVTYTEALDFLAENQNDVDITDVKVVAYYSETVSPGYYVPCYRFYLNKTSNDSVENNSNEYAYTIDVSLIAEEPR